MIKENPKQNETVIHKGEIGQILMPTLRLVRGRIEGAPRGKCTPPRPVQQISFRPSKLGGAEREAPEENARPPGRRLFSSGAALYAPSNLLCEKRCKLQNPQKNNLPGWQKVLSTILRCPKVGGWQTFFQSGKKNKWGWQKVLSTILRCPKVGGWQKVLYIFQIKIKILK